MITGTTMSLVEGLIDRYGRRFLVRPNGSYGSWKGQLNSIFEGYNSALATGEDPYKVIERIRQDIINYLENGRHLTKKKVLEGLPKFSDPIKRRLGRMIDNSWDEIIGQTLEDGLDYPTRRPNH